MLWTFGIKSVIVQVQHVNNKKYNNSFTSKWRTYTTNKTQLSVEYCNVKETRLPFLMWNEMQIYI